MFFLGGLATIWLGFVGFVALVVLKQHSMVYHRRAYDARYARALPECSGEVSYGLPFGEQKGVARFFQRRA